jgi:hypothetical protein
MSQKQAKKIRQLYRRDMRSKITESIEAFKKEFGDLLKPAPRLIPEFIWVSLQKLFLNI